MGSSFFFTAVYSAASMRDVIRGTTCLEIGVDFLQIYVCDLAYPLLTYHDFDAELAATDVEIASMETHASQLRF